MEEYELLKNNTSERSQSAKILLKRAGEEVEKVIQKFNDIVGEGKVISNITEYLKKFVSETETAASEEAPAPDAAPAASEEAAPDASEDASEEASSEEAAAPAAPAAAPPAPDAAAAAPAPAPGSSTSTSTRCSSSSTSSRGAAAGGGYFKRCTRTIKWIAINIKFVTL